MIRFVKKSNPITSENGNVVQMIMFEVKVVVLLK